MGAEGRQVWPSRWQRVVLAVLGLANAWSAYRTRYDHPLPAFLNAAAACVLLVFALVPRRAKGEAR